MRAAERGFLLLSSCLGDPMRKPLTTSQLRILADRMWKMDFPTEERELEMADLIALGYGRPMAARILKLLSDGAVLDHYLQIARRKGCTPLTRITGGYPLILRQRLALESPGVLWTKGELSLLAQPKIALVGSRDLHERNAAFAREVGEQAARQGYVLVSGNARGADRTAQEACLNAGGSVIIVVADSLIQQKTQDRVLYISEEDYDLPFSTQRALSRNRVIHALARLTFVAQSSYQTGGTWDGTVRNLQGVWNDVFCFDDGSAAVKELCQMGAKPVKLDALRDFSGLPQGDKSLFEQ
ncbi:MAG: DNA-protecting protein DprA [Oscillospiraceae bacterium]|nr:DNA-protecting protein DprA [Oscillospiraceae bacterium]